MNRKNTASGRRRRGTTSAARRWALAAVVSVGLLAGTGCPNGKKNKGSDAGDSGTVEGCDYDDINKPGKAADLEIGSATEGYICPKGDEDWYNIEATEGRSILGISLKMKTKLTEISPTYSIHKPGSGESAGETVASPPGGASKKELDVEHCLDQGNYKMVVQDAGNDNSDLRHPYRLKVSSRKNPDTAEPNDERNNAIPLKPGQPKKGYIACRGDVDWYKIQVPEDRLVRYKLTANKPTYQPKAAFYQKGEEKPLAEAVNEASPREKTALDQFVVIPEKGTYFLAVSDDDNSEADATIPYEVQFTLLKDEDRNEPNNKPEKATEAGTMGNCGGGWTKVIDTVGTVGQPGDEDWFKIPLQGCDPGVIDARMEIQTSGLSTKEQWKINKNVQSDLTLVREHSKNPDLKRCKGNNKKCKCKMDAECKVLTGRSCQSDVDPDDPDCEGHFETCTNQGKCAGMSECLGSGKCAVKQIQRHYECNDRFEECDSSSGKSPPANLAAFGAPIFGDDVLYLRAADYQSNGADPDAVYSLKVRVQKEPDSNERNNVYSSRVDKEPSVSDHRDRAVQIPIYDCTPPSQSTQGTLSDAGDTSIAMDANMDGVADTTMPMDTGGGGMDTGGGTMDTGGGANLPDGCCSNKPWVSGAISYEFDRDWFEYQHPCPGSDCTLRFHYKVDGGAVDTEIEVYRGGSPWAGPTETEEKKMQSPRNGTFGGDTQQDKCFYGYHDHGSGNGSFKYGVNVFDEVETEEQGELTITNPTSRDWDPNQSYSFCVEKISNKCEEPPCKVYEKQPDGCGKP